MKLRDEEISVKVPRVDGRLENAGDKLCLTVLHTFLGSRIL